MLGSRCHARPASPTGASQRHAGVAFVFGIEKIAERSPCRIVSTAARSAMPAGRLGRRPSSPCAGAEQ
eukprot:6658097-Prymnesium_polylepis.1